MAAATKYVLAPTGSTGNPTPAAIELTGIFELAQVAFQFVVEVAGSTPTITFKYQGSVDNVNFFDIIYFPTSTDTLSVAAQTVVAVGATLNWLDSGNNSRAYRYYKVVPTANTNVTFRAELYAFNVPR